jgi:predicted dinucleotide-binding enzyme
VEFGTIGAGTVAQAIAGHLVRAGHHVTLSNSRGPESLGDIVSRLGPLASAGTVSDAAAADMVFLAVMWRDVPAALSDLPPWDGRILIDTTNRANGSTPSDSVDAATTGELVAEYAPGARVVKAFNALYARYISADPRHAAGRQLLFYAGDDISAKTAFRGVADDLGFAAVDAGSLREGGRLMDVGGGLLSALHALKQD